AVPGTARDMETLLRDALDVLEIPGERDVARFVARVSLPERRFHRVYIETTAGPRLADRLVKISAICARLVPAYLRTGRRLNATLSHGAIAIAAVGGVPHFIVQSSYPRATCDPAEIRRSVSELARRADEVERSLSGADVY